MKRPPIRLTSNNLTGVARTRRPMTRHQRLTVVYGILCLVLTLVILQLWLLTATMNAFLGGDSAVIWPAGAASVVCLLLNLGLLRYLYAMDKTSPASEQP
jgi:hypothetical protein